MSFGKIYRFVALVLIITLWGCAIYRKPPEGYVKEDEITTKRLLGIIDSSTITTLTADIRASIHTGDILRGTFTGRLLYKKAKGLRSYFMGPFGMVVADVLIKDSTVKLFLPSKGIIYSARIPAEGMFLVSGQELNRLKPVLKNNKDTVDLILIDNSIYRIYTFDRHTLKWSRFRVYYDKERVIDMTIREHSGGIPVDFTLKYRGLSANIRINNLLIGQTIPDKAFTLPETGKSISLSELLYEMDH